MVSVGQCYRLVDREQVIYITVSQVDEKVAGWRFLAFTGRRLEIVVEPDLQPGFLVEHCVEVPRDVFVVEFNSLLAAVASFVTQMPT